MNIGRFIYHTVSAIWNSNISEHSFRGPGLFMRNDFMPTASLAMLTVTNDPNKRISRMYGGWLAMNEPDRV
uniref:Uncharacterized protein n=1 Tax=Candidatus Methanogaster sp. ANME-2c ERB4 TaxID=2759911 RepID=A0A7G9YQS9_9EURY|nr:hypothetical protein MOOKMAHM_00028 [Methanosarcinales archaeon ANME-2c ERB4]QNO45117.1 hypothetical protein AGMAKMMB_00004 [Methanosarcinales archaeon ANME-2c ERB4]QNO50363.1 hypothetical protein BOLHPIDD_00004 [Methanosarcinales archaeon ANME-2c ERB4]